MNIFINSGLIFTIGNKITIEKNASTIITELSGRATAYGSSGIQLTLNSNECLAYDVINDVLFIRDRARVGITNEVALIITQYNGICGRVLYPKMIEKHLSQSIIYNKKFYAYIADNKGLSFRNGTSGGTIVTLYSSLLFQNTSNQLVSKNQSQIIEDLGSSFATAYGSEGVEIVVGSGRAIVVNLDNNILKEMSRNDLGINDYPLLIGQYGGICGGYLYSKYIECFCKDIENNAFFLTDGALPSSNPDEKAQEFSDLFIDAEETESFLFFTDPHTVNASVTDLNMRKGINLIEYAFNKTPTTYCICGGDWLSNNDTKAIALGRLGYIDGFMRKKFGDYYLPILGNHDTNYQGIDEEGSASNTGQLTSSCIEQIWFRKYGHIYYTYKAINSRFYIFDTETDWAGDMTDYRWQQIDWFATQLIQNDDAHSIIFQHIFTNATKANLEADVPANVVPFSQNIFEVAQKYNAKSTVTLNGQTYDFTNTTGKIAFAQAGHSHYDSIVTYKDIPVVLTINAGTNPKFDLCYVDYTHEKYKMIRVGQDDTYNREVSIIV